jgi:hypothetical protein
MKDLVRTHREPFFRFLSVSVVLGKKNLCLLYHTNI